MNEPVGERQSQSSHPAIHLGRLLRPTHWLKNVFVVIPVPFALGGGGVLEFSVFGVGLLAMCVANSSVYVFNDWFDIERDRVHPIKRFRPLASKQVSEPTALMLSASLAVLAMLLAVAYLVSWSISGLSTGRTREILPWMCCSLLHR